ncbi:hypothetical protein LSAT2_015893 [Lamellibrachia satsuma]|nr:hypothetical protein LSAT2_015893 [Lamellibrachia satsuma]
MRRTFVDHAIAVDVVSQLVYYTDSGSIFAMKLEGGYPISLITSGQPGKALVLDPKRGMMYWLNGRNIDAAAMDGTQHRVITHTTGDSTGLTIDSQGERLYWSTVASWNSQGELGSVTLDGSSRTLLMQRPESRITGLAFLGGSVYYIDRLSRFIWKLDLSESTPTPEPVGPAMYGMTSGIAAYSSEQYTQGAQTNGSCGISNGGCKDMCLSTPGGPRCACRIAAKFVFGSQCSFPRSLSKQVGKIRRSIFGHVLRVLVGILHNWPCDLRLLDQHDTGVALTGTPPTYLTCCYQHSKRRASSCGRSKTL